MIASSMKRRAFAAGEHIVSEGEGGVGFFFVESGTVVVSKDGNRIVELGSGDHFGEIALLAGGRSHRHGERRVGRRLLGHAGLELPAAGARAAERHGQAARGDGAAARRLLEARGRPRRAPVVLT